ncbi:DUF502 domain-containing protein [Halovivax limisalsi]|uniref:DUF502 domain-containing protein n=1 Tax=Halovivax limisalsi TaxID=1453760 RepID=UPI001FFCE817|nr:DUF502 domain-containing protein [Halovivax limisalsi]
MVDVTKTIRRWFVNGIAITIPLVVTLIVLLVVFDFVLGILSPVIDGVELLWNDEPPRAVVQLLTLGSLVGFFLLVGAVASHTPGERFSSALHRTVETIPGVSTVYLTIRRASEVLLEDDADQFKDVKLVAFPHENAYMLGFLTAETPDEIAGAVGADRMQTIMIPLGPNPTTNGFVMHVPEDNVHEVDVTVEAAIQAIATLGVATETSEFADSAA